MHASVFLGGEDMRNIRLDGMARTAAVACLLVACVQETDTDERYISRAEQPERAGHHEQIARLMTRNLYLGADLAPAIGAPDLASFVAGTGAVLRQVTPTNFPVRAKGPAAAILPARPELGRL